MIMLLILISYEKSLAIYYLFNIFSYIKVHVLIKSVEVGGEVSHDEQEEQQEHQLRGHLKLFSFKHLSGWDNSSGLRELNQKDPKNMQKDFCR